MLKTVLLSLLALVVVAAAIVAWSYWRFAAAIDDDVRRLAAAASRETVIVTEEMLAGLPPVVQGHLRQSGVVGRAIPTIVRLRQTGRIRSSVEASWMSLEAEEVYSTDPPAFVWRASFPSAGLPLVTGRDEYRQGGGSILMKMLALFPVADESGGELVAAGLMRYLNEIMWFPQAYLGGNISWRGIDDTSAEVTIADRGMTASAILFFDGEGRLTNFRAQRHNTATRQVETWETPITGYGELDGLQLPIRGEGVWKQAGGDFAYIEVEVTALAFDEAALP